jgi:hypothetical protein
MPDADLPVDRHADSHPPEPLEQTLSGTELYFALGVLANIAVLCGGATGPAEFGPLRQRTGLLPEHLVAAIEALRVAGCLHIEKNATGNPYGNLRLTSLGQELSAPYAQQAERFLANCPPHYKVRAPERSSRRGGRVQEAQPARAAASSEDE